MATVRRSIPARTASTRIRPKPAHHRKPSDQRAAIRWAKRILESPRKYAIVDTETTGLGSTAEVIEIACIDPTGEVLFNSRVRPLHRKRIAPEATCLHGITMTMLAGEPTYPDISKDLRRTLRGRVLIAYNADFDRRLLKQTAARNGGKAPSRPWDCAMRTYARFWGEWNANRRDYRWQKLTGGDHSALGDCRATLARLHEMAAAKPLRRWYEFWVSG